MRRLIYDTLSELGYPVYLQGTIASNEEYPESFITFFTIDSPAAAEFDNETAATAWNYSVQFYSSDPAAVMIEPDMIRAAMHAAGFKAQGKGRDIPSDVETHTGWTCDFYYIENEMEG